jgi:hypothetical protein
MFLMLLTLMSCGQKKNLKPQYPNCISTDIEQMDTCIIGLTIQEAVERIGLDTSKIFVIDEPPGIARGISGTLGDSCEIRLYVTRTSMIQNDDYDYRIDYSLIANKNIIGLSWRKPKIKKGKVIGEVVWQLEF